MAARRLPGPALLLGVLLVALSVLPGQANTRAAPAVAASEAPAFDHIFVILEENQDYDRIVRNPEAPFINSLIAANFLQTDYHALGHGSLPDYLGLVSGSVQSQAIGTPSRDCTPDWAANPPSCAVTAPDPSNIADLIEHSGRSWRAYLQGMEQPCRWQSASADYDIFHNPFVYFATIEGGGAASSKRCVERDVDMYGDPRHTLHADLMSASTTPNFVFIVPSNHNNMHDDRWRPADNFLRDILTGTNTSGQNSTNAINIFSSPAWTNGRSIAYIVWDEDSGPRINHVPAVVVGNWVNGPHGEDGATFDHYSMLKTWEAAWGLPSIQSAGGDASATPMLGAFKLSDAAAAAKTSKRLALNAAHPEVFVQVDAKIASGRTPSLLSVYGDDGVAKFRLRVSSGGTVALDNGIAATTRTSATVFGPGWHRIELHVWVAGGAGTCEVSYDGRPVAELSQLDTCPTGTTPIGSIGLGDIPADQGGAASFNAPVIATGRISGGVSSAPAEAPETGSRGSSPARGSAGLRPGTMRHSPGPV